MPGKSTKTTEERFKALVDVPDDPDACWLWRGSGTVDGYGHIGGPGGRQGKTIRAHRLAWQMAYGPIPDGMQVCHRCDVRACVRPDHLFLGTGRDNTRDMLTKDRAARGERSPHAKLTDAQVREIRGRYAVEDIEQKELARMYGVSNVAILDVVRRKTWKHLA